MSRLTTMRGIFKILPFPLRCIDALAGSFKLGHWRRFGRKNVDLSPPQQTVSQCGIMLHSNENANRAGYQQKQNETADNQAALAEATHSAPILPWWRLEPGVHFSLGNPLS